MAFGRGLRASVLVSALFACSLGCQPGTPMMVDPPCDLTSDCTRPLVCRDGLCEVECISQLDCLRGTHCAPTMGLGECFIDQPLDHTTSPCGTGRACDDASQVCRDFSCWEPCTTSSDCVMHSYCRRGVCANPDSPGYGYGMRVPCTAASDCATGEICATDHGSERTCRLPCTADTDCTDVAADAICAAIDDPSVPAGTMACVIGCDPVRQLGCINHDRCEAQVALGVGGTPHTVLDCIAPTGMTIQGASCGTSASMLGTCAQNLGCAPPMADMTTGCECLRFCVVDGDCHDASLHCTARAQPIENIHAVTGVLHMCAP
jgi:hypothetical protein